jgi:hypothetical protein
VNIDVRELLSQREQSSLDPGADGLAELVELEAVDLGPVIERRQVRRVQHRESCATRACLDEAVPKQRIVLTRLSRPTTTSPFVGPVQSSGTDATATSACAATPAAVDPVKTLRSRAR